MLTSKQAFAHFKKVLLEHSIQRPPYSVGVFSLKDVQLVVDYVTDSYFRHFKLYRYAFTKKQVLAFSTMPSFVETALVPAPLCEGVPIIEAAEEEDDVVPEEPEPDMLDDEDEADDTLVGRKIRALTGKMAEQVQNKHAALEAKIVELEARLADQ
jgi:hypothetical protein